MPNSSLATNTRFGAAVSPGGVTVPAAVAADVNGNLIRTADAGDGTSYLGGSFASLTYASASRSAANTGDTFATAGLTRLAVDITVTSFTAGTSPSLTFFLDRQGNDGVWYRVYTSAALNSAGATVANVGDVPATTGCIPAVLTATARFGWTVAGAPTSFVFSASVVGRP